MNSQIAGYREPPPYPASWTIFPDGKHAGRRWQEVLRVDFEYTEKVLAANSEELPQFLQAYKAWILQYHLAWILRIRRGSLSLTPPAAVSKAFPLETDVWEERKPQRRSTSELNCARTSEGLLASMNVECCKSASTMLMDNVSLSNSSGLTVIRNFARLATDHVINKSSDSLVQSEELTGILADAIEEELLRSQLEDQEEVPWTWLNMPQ